jgi:hypothetical protein
MLSTNTPFVATFRHNDDEARGCPVTIESHLRSGTVFPVSVPCLTRSTPVLAYFTVRGHLCVVLSNVNVTPRESMRALHQLASALRHFVTPRTTTRLCLSTVSAVPWSLLVDSLGSQPQPRQSLLTSTECICACPHLWPFTVARNMGWPTLDNLASPCRDSGNVIARPPPLSPPTALLGPDGHTV